MNFVLNCVVKNIFFHTDVGSLNMTNVVVGCLD